LVEKAIKGGVTAVQFRDKKLADNEFLSSALELQKICSKYHVPFIINDRVDICLAVNADGVHLGQHDMPVEAARKLLGADKIIGISANSLEELEKANNSSADYIGFGAIFSTPVKETYKDFGVEIIPKVLKISRLPVVFIGGISLSNIQSVRDAGAKNVAVVRALMDAEDPEQAAKKLREW
jgi:thiamine-phosphate diphosphorylase